MGMNIGNREFTKKELQRSSANIAQLVSAREVELLTGRGRGMRLYQVRTPAGLALDLMPERCLDIASLSYKGYPVSLLTRNDLTAPALAYPEKGEFDRYFSGGMLMTCGLKNAGPDYRDKEGHFHHLHGRINTLPCRQSWMRGGFEGDDYVLRLGGVTEDSLMESYQLQLTREVVIHGGKAEIELTDTVENLDYHETDYLLLYHFNFGFPFVEEGLRLKFPRLVKEPVPRTEAAADGLWEWDTVTGPVDDEEENVFFLHPEEGADELCVCLENKRLGIGARLTYERKYLPVLVYWKCMRSGEYALGVEPSNNYIGSMPGERERGMARRIAPGETHAIHIRLAFYELDAEGGRCYTLKER